MTNEHLHEIDSSENNERKTLTVIVLTVITMIIEITCGYMSNSMALLADGWHMGTHALALGITYAAYILIRRFKKSPLFPSGTDKIGSLAAYTSSLFLGLAGLWIIFEAVLRIINPLSIHFDEALLIAVIGLIVNAVCICIMETPHLKKKCSETDKKNEDYNFKAAYYHIAADILTSILAIGALITAKYFNILCFDALAGILGGILILKWAAGLLKRTAAILIDMKEQN